MFQVVELKLKLKLKMKQIKDSNATKVIKKRDLDAIFPGGLGL